MKPRRRKRRETTLDRARRLMHQHEFHVVPHARRPGAFVCKCECGAYQRGSIEEIVTRPRLGGFRQEPS